ncbi:MAG: hypothetical protein N2V73_08195 [Candidatus Methanospirare jalkutatii]|nr:hypothetical protein [Candidatus Methanospirare jalkutatii]MCW7080747.1 hypothetical protein [Candidatus Methanospirare jalkutatii]
MGVLKWVLRVIPTLLFILCVLAAFATHGFSLKSTLFSASPEEVLAEMLTPLNATRGEEFLKIVDAGVEGDKMFVTLSACSPFPANVPANVTVKSASLYAGGSEFSLVEPVVIPAGGSAILRFEAPLNASSAQQAAAGLEVGKITLKMEVKGVEVEFQSFATPPPTAADRRSRRR